MGPPGWSAHARIHATRRSERRRTWERAGQVVRSEIRGSITRAQQIKVGRTISFETTARRIPGQIAAQVAPRIGVFTVILTRAFRPQENGPACGSWREGRSGIPCGAMTIRELRQLLDDVRAGTRPHAERLAVSAAIVSAVLRERGMEATLVGGGAIEFHAGDTYTTSDVDLIVEGKSRVELDAALTEFGFERRGRHWVLGDLFVEVRGNWMPDPVDVVSVGGLPLRVVRREIVLADRIIGFKHWRTTAYGAQAIALLALFGSGEGLDRACCANGCGPKTRRMRARPCGAWPPTVRR